jgi:mono/diheme cytochrome c family protein
LIEVNAPARQRDPDVAMCKDRPMWMVWVVAVAVSALVVPPAVAQDAGDRLAGRELATRWCSSCHVVDPTQQRQGSDAVPTFASIAAMQSTTAASLRAFLSTPHTPMPDFSLSRDDIANVSAYILSLRK